MKRLISTAAFLSAFFAISCSNTPTRTSESVIASVASKLPSDYETWTANKKIDFLWTQRVVPTKYPALPEILAANPIVPLLNMAFTMDTLSDELPDARPKAIHRSGAVAKLAFVAEQNSPLTGLWRGFDSGLIRLSAATKNADTLTPGAAIKMFVNGAPSQNFVAMHDLDGQADFNFFAQAFSNVIAPPTNPLLKIIGKAFGRASPFPTGVYLQDIATVTQEGVRENAPVFPYRIFMEPNTKFKSFASTPHDFRQDLATIPAGTLLYSVYAVIPKSFEDDAAADAWGEINAESYRKQAIKVGSFMTKSEFIASQWIDEKLFFKHQRYANKK